MFRFFEAGADVSPFVSSLSASFWSDSRYLLPRSFYLLTSKAGLSEFTLIDSFSTVYFVAWASDSFAAYSGSLKTFDAHEASVSTFCTADP